MIAGLMITALVALGMGALGIALLRGHGAMLIAGYNTLSPEEQATWNAPLLCKATGKAVLALDACTLLWMLAIYLDRMWIFWVGFAAFLVILLCFLVYVNTDERFRKAVPPTSDHPEK
jgi:hypothetical protein